MLDAFFTVNHSANSLVNRVKYALLADAVLYDLTVAGR
jgi:hypothetical protein